MSDIFGVLGELAAGSIRALAQNLFSGFYERGLSANKALQELQSEGLGYRRTDFLSDYRAGRGEFDRASSIRNVNLGAIPTERILEPNYFGTPDKYSFTFQYTGEDATTGEQAQGYFMYHRNTLDTRQSMEQDANDYIESNSEKYGVIITTVRVVQGYINPVWQ